MRSSVDKFCCVNFGPIMVFWAEIYQFTYVIFELPISCTFKQNIFDL